MNEFTIEAVEWSCCECGVTSWMAEKENKHLVATGKTFYCLNGHAQSYKDSCASKIKKLENDLEFRTNQRNWALERENALHRRLSAHKGQITKLKKKLDPPEEE